MSFEWQKIELQRFHTTLQFRTQHLHGITISTQMIDYKMYLYVVRKYIHRLGFMHICTIKLSYIHDFFFILMHIYIYIMYILYYIQMHYLFCKEL